MKRDDPKVLKLRADRERAETRLNILMKGIGLELQQGCGRCYDSEDLLVLIDIVNGELLPAIKATHAAQEAYRPYWGRVRRLHNRRVAKKNPRKKSPANKVV